jgi:CHRD domain/PEP-CTERM motif
MKTKLPPVLLLLAVISIVLPTANAQQEIFTATLDGPSESPADASPGTGFATVTLDLSLSTMRVQVSFSGLVGLTTASHIHAATATAFTGTAGVATTTPTFAGFPLGVTSGTYDNTLDLTQASSFNPAFVTAQGGVPQAATALISATETGKAYLNIHTQTFPGGEIRGFLVQVPEPTTVALLAMGGLGLLLGTHKMRRR